MRLILQACLTALILGAVSTSLGQAQDSGVTYVAPTDYDTVAVPRGLEGVGRLDIAGPNGLRGFCTALLVAPTQILTAAHCLYDSTTGLPFSAEGMVFHTDQNVGTRQISRVTEHPEYEYSLKANHQSIRTDLALLQLAQPIALPTVKTFGTPDALLKGSPVQLVSYALGRQDRPEVEQDCLVLDRDTRVLVLSCSIDYGSSGAPVFVRQGNRLEVVSVISAMSHWHDRPVALAVLVDDGLETLRLAAMRTAPVPSQSQTLPQEAKVFKRGETGTMRFHRPTD